MGDMSAVESGITRQLQHAVLQLCNEHVSYEHTLQVLGVVCVTVDDGPRDVVVKLNNTLKRVDAVAPVADDRRSTGVRAASSTATLWSRGVPGSGEQASSFSASGTAVGSSTSGDGSHSDRMSGRQACTDATTPVAMVVGARKCHGRKQSNPVKVKSVVNNDDEQNDDDKDDDDDDDDEDREDEPCSDGVLVIAPADPSAGDDEFNTSSLTSLRPGRNHSGSEDSPHHRRSQLDLRVSPAVSGTSAVRALLTGKPDRMASGRAGTSNGVHSAARSLISSPLVDSVPDPIVVVPTEYTTSPDGVRRDSFSNDEQQTALNFSTRTLDRRRSTDAGSSPDCPSTDVHIKKELHQHNVQLGSYGVDAGRAGSTFNMSRSMSVAAAAFNQYVDDPTVLQSLSSYDQQRLAFYTSLVTAAAAGVAPNTADDGQSATISLLNGSSPNIGECSPAKLDLSTNYSASSSRQSDGLAMAHRLSTVRRRERFSQHCPPPVKVKDIIMYDDSAPLHVQRGSRIEGDFMLDALHVEGRKRRRRTAEDTLTPEEIAEYMGTSTATGSGQFACRYCGEVSGDLSRYFGHTLTSHGSFVCHQCGKSFTTKSSLLRHRPIHTGMRRFACSICRKAFYRKDKCKAHIKRHLGLVDRPGPSPSPAALTQSAGPATPQLLSSVDQQLMSLSAGPVNLAV